MKMALPILIILLAAGCKTTIDKPEDSGIKGGKGGNYALTVFPLNDTTGTHGICYIKYAAAGIPSSYKEYNDSSATMVEPGYGPHAHFLGLKAGMYAIAVRTVNNKLHGDTIVEIKEGQTVNTEFSIALE